MSKRRQREDLDTVLNRVASSINKQLSRTVQAELEKHAKVVEMDVQARDEAAARQREKVDKYFAAQLKNIAAAIELIKQSAAAVRTTRDVFRNDISALKLELGLVQRDTTGYLTRHYPSPPGWNQQQYEASCFRAATFYVAQLGNPPNGVHADEEAFLATREEFPHLVGDHLVAALQHAHVLIYNKPFTRVAPQSEVNLVAG